MRREEFFVQNGRNLSWACKYASELAEENDVVVFFSFNGIEVNVLPGDTKEKAFELYHKLKDEAA